MGRPGGRGPGGWCLPLPPVAAGRPRGEEADYCGGGLVQGCCDCDNCASSV